MSSLKRSLDEAQPESVSESPQSKVQRADFESLKSAQKRIRDLEEHVDDLYAFIGTKGLITTLPKELADRLVQRSGGITMYFNSILKRIDTIAKKRYDYANVDGIAKAQSELLGDIDRLAHLPSGNERALECMCRMSRSCSGGLGDLKRCGYGGAQKPFEDMDRAMLQYAKIRQLEQHDAWDKSEIINDLKATTKELSLYGAGKGYVVVTQKFLADPTRFDLEVETEPLMPKELVGTKAGRGWHRTAEAIMRDMREEAECIEFAIQNGNLPRPDYEAEFVARMQREAEV